MPKPEGLHIFGTVKVGERGQIVIPKEARDILGIKAGDSLLILGDEKQGLAIMKNDAALAMIAATMRGGNAAEHEQIFAAEVLDAQRKEIREGD